jgi:aminopeptidase-like protein
MDESLLYLFPVTQLLMQNSMDKFLDFGDGMYQLIEKLYPICRSITGNGVRKTLGILREEIPIEIFEVKTGKAVFDWKVPREWNISGAYIKNSKGTKILDFDVNNLHVLNYSIPVDKTITLEELKKHIFTLPSQPDLIPYRTSYYQENWGFCMSHNQFLALEDDLYEVKIDSQLEDGSLTYGELYLPGDTDREVLISTHICHPSLCNDNLSGISVVVQLAKWLMSIKRRYSYRLIFIPGTIGAITWLAENETKTNRIDFGLVAALLGDSGKFHYKKSRRGNAKIDQIVEYVLEQSKFPYEIVDFFPYGYDERQFCSPGFNLPVGSLTRSIFGTFPEYHTSADNLKFVNSVNLAQSFKVYVTIMSVIENNITYLSNNLKCEPQLGKYGLYQKIGGTSQNNVDQLTLLWLLNMADGGNDLLDIARRSKIKFETIKEAALLLNDCGLITETNQFQLPREKTPSGTSLLTK